MHVHVHSADGEAKFWLEPKIELAQNHGLSPKSLRGAQKLIQAHESTIRQAWKAHFDRISISICPSNLWTTPKISR